MIVTRRLHGKNIWMYILEFILEKNRSYVLIVIKRLDTPVTWQNIVGFTSVETEVDN